MSDLISREAAIDEIKNMYEAAEKWGREATDEMIKVRAESCMASLIEMKLRIEKLPSAQPEEKPIDYQDCSDALLRMWMDNVIADGEYWRIIDKLNTNWGEER